MASVTWTQHALTDVEAIGTRIGASASIAAAIFINRIFDSVERVGTFPGSGRVVPEFGRDDVREVIVGSYRVMYRAFEESVLILAGSTELGDPIGHVLNRQRGGPEH